MRKRPPPLTHAQRERLKRDPDVRKALRAKAKALRPMGAALKALYQSARQAKIRAQILEAHRAHRAARREIDRLHDLRERLYERQERARARVEARFERTYDEAWRAYLDVRWAARTRLFGRKAR